MATAYRRKRHGKRRTHKKYRRYGNPSISLAGAQGSVKQAVHELPAAAWLAGGMFANQLALRAVQSALPMTRDGIPSYVAQTVTALALGFVPKVGHKLVGGAVLGLVLRGAGQVFPTLKFSGLIDSETGQSDHPLPGFGELIDDNRFRAGGRFGEFATESEFKDAAVDAEFPG